MDINADFSERENYNYCNSPIYIEEGHLSDYPDYRALAHWHDDIELLSVISGELQYNVNGQIVTVTQGNGVFVNSRQMHFGYSANRSECIYICVRVHPRLLCVNTASEQEFVIPILTNTELDHICLQQEKDWQAQILRLMTAMNEVKESKAAQLKTLGFFLQIWALLFENVSCTEAKLVKNADYACLNAMLSFVQQNYAEKLSLAQIASAGAIGQSKCCRLFARYIGQTPNDYLNSCRLQKCTELLKGTDMTVTEIALATGFCGSSYLAELFRRQYGITPTGYRKSKIFSYN